MRVRERENDNWEKENGEGERGKKERYFCGRYQECEKCERIANQKRGRQSIKK